MKNNCWFQRHLKTLVCGLACIILSNALAATGLAQSRKFNPTPDPYFKQELNSKLLQPIKPQTNKLPIAKSPIANSTAEPSPPPSSPPSLWNPPRTISPSTTGSLNTHSVAPASPNLPGVNPSVASSSSGWEAPLTNVPIARTNEQQPDFSNPVEPKIHNQPIRVGSSTAPVPTLPRTTNAFSNSESISPSDSIIREHPAPVASNQFSPPAYDDSNSFGSPIEPVVPNPVMAKPLTPKPLAPNATAPQSGNQFASEFTPQSDSTTAENPPTIKRTTRLEPVIPEKELKLQTAQQIDTFIDEEEPEAFEPGKVLALVGGEPIFVGDVIFEINQTIEKFMAGAPEEVKERERQKMIPQILPKFVESKLLFVGALSSLPEGANIDDVLEQAGKEFDEKALKKMMKNTGIESISEFDANLRVQGSSLRKLRRSWSQQQLTRFFLSRQLSSKTEVTHQEMLDKYRENIASYEIPAKCRWEQLMIRFDRSESRDAAKKQLSELGNQVVFGASLEAVAKKSSHGFLASNGGQHDWTTKDALVLKEIDEAIFTQPIGELSDIIETRDGFHIVRVLERTEATRTPFLEAQVAIKSRIIEEKRKSAFVEHVAKLKRQIPVEYPSEAR